jgi:CheY-like chemotaxis protein
LESIGLFVLAARDGAEALHVSRRFAGPIHILVSDVVMPNLDGVTLCQQILLERPATKILLISAYVTTPLDGLPFLRKPFHLDVLRRRVREILGALP